ncbi:MAG: phosphoribosylanthranilate isomerase [Acidimicrobiaceae bacterium]|nr:phosphoribosylanthranilate isomerase [Acidimicrobiaceae bacterium]
MFIKICGITSEEDALLATALGADAVGFVFAPSSRQVAVDRARDIARRLPAEVLTVGVFRNELPDRVVNIMHRAGLGAAQLHGHESPEQSREVRSRVPRMIKGFFAIDPGLSDVASYNADVALIDSPTPGGGEVFDWSLVENVPLSGIPLLLAGGLDADNVRRAIHKVAPWGVDVSTGVERAPGEKDPVKMRRFIDTARAAFTEVRMRDRVEVPNVPYNWEDDF